MPFATAECDPREIPFSRNARAFSLYDPPTTDSMRCIRAKTPYQYTNGYLDSTGLYHLGARYYNPTDGRFTQQDPAGKGPNINIYAGDSPVSYTDPTGLDLFDDITGGLSLATGIAGTALDATGVAAPVGLALNAVSAGLGGLQAGVDCAEGQANCAASATSAVLGFGGFGLGLGLGDGGGIGPDIVGDTASGSGFASGIYCDFDGC